MQVQVYSVGTAVSVGPGAAQDCKDFSYPAAQLLIPAARRSKKCAKNSAGLSALSTATNTDNKN